MIDAIEKAKKEAEMLRKARLLSHVLDSNDDIVEQKLVCISYQILNALIIQIGTDQLDGFERARMQLHAIERQKKLDRESLEKSHRVNDKKSYETKLESGGGGGGGTKVCLDVSFEQLSVFAFLSNCISFIGFVKQINQFIIVNR